MPGSEAASLSPWRSDLQDPSVSVVTQSQNFFWKPCRLPPPLSFHLIMESEPGCWETLSPSSPWRASITWQREPNIACVPHQGRGMTLFIPILPNSSELQHEPLLNTPNNRSEVQLGLTTRSFYAQNLCSKAINQSDWDPGLQAGHAEPGQATFPSHGHREVSVTHPPPRPTPVSRSTCPRALALHRD